MKKIALFLVFVLLFSQLTFSVNAAETVTAQDSGFTNVLFSNGYRGFCLDQTKKGANSGDSFTATGSTEDVRSNLDGSDVANRLKILFTQCFESLFVSDGNGSYRIDNESNVQAIIWHYTDNYYIWGTQKTLYNFVEDFVAQNPNTVIPDRGYTVTLGNGDNVTFYFMRISTDDASQQDFFGYKIEVSNEPPHTHVFPEEWESDGENHWHECECGEKTETGSHNGNEADCVTPSVCETCEKQLENVNPNKHTGNTVVKNAETAEEFKEGYTGDIHCADCDGLLQKGEKIPQTHRHVFPEEWESDGENHWHECACGEKTETGSHNGNEADCVTPSVCETCEKQLENVNPNKHTGNTVVKNAELAEEFKEGYTGDVHCADCDALLEKGEKIPATHRHVFPEEWESDGENHWHECECGETSDVEPHIYVEEECIVCGRIKPPVPETSSKGYTVELLALFMGALGVCLITKKRVHNA